MDRRFDMEETVFWTSFRDELKVCKILTLGVVVYTFSVVLIFVVSVLKGNPLWFLLLSLLVVWITLAPKRIKVCKDGIVRFGRLILWRDLKLVGEENGKLLFKYRDLELRIPKDLVREHDIQDE
jgi:hypothetical protein